MITRRSFLSGIAGGAVITTTGSGGRYCLSAETVGAGVSINAPLPREDIFGYIQRTRGNHDGQLYAQILGAANEFKEGDAIIGVAAADDSSRQHARSLLANTRVGDLDAQPVYADPLFRFINAPDQQAVEHRWATKTLDQLKQFLLSSSEAAIKSATAGLSSDVIGCVVKLMSNEELIQVSRKIFNPLPGSKIGARGYLGARIQPNSPTDNTDDILWQVLDGWSYAVGDVLLGNNPVSSEPESVAAIERTLQDLLETFELSDVMPHCVLAHIDVQAEVEDRWPGSTELWFQSIAGSETANETFDISVDKMRRYASKRDGRYGMYFETGQGADFTNGHSHGFDMVIHESRKYGFARALTAQVAAAQRRSGRPAEPWVHLNDVAGFIGPEVFRTRQQLVRCCLEDLVMGKLHGLCIGLDVCSTLHMDISLDDLDWCLDEIMPANPAYLMALPTKIDPMLGYLTTGYQDHVRLRNKFGYRVNDPMWAFFQRLGVIDAQGDPGEHFADPLWVYLQYRRRKGDSRTEEAILEEGRAGLAAVRSRGVFVAEGHGENAWDLEASLKSDIVRIYDDAKLSIWAELDAKFIDAVPNGLPLETESADRNDYILHPTSGERISEGSQLTLQRLRRQQAGRFDVQIVISDGLNALAIMEQGHLPPFLQQLRQSLAAQGVRVAPQQLVVTSGRVRAGYRIGEAIFADLPDRRGILHLIGERPGTGHRTFSTYITAATGNSWGKSGTIDHNITKVVSGIANTALNPAAGAQAVARLLAEMIGEPS